MLRRLLVRWIVTAVAVGLTALLLPGIHINGGILALLGIALVWGLVDGVLGPIARFVSLPLTIMSFGLFVLFVNGLLFAVTAWVAHSLSVDNFLWAVLGALVLTVVTFILNALVERSRLRSQEHRG